MKLVVFSDIHGDVGTLRKALADAYDAISSADLVVCNGDFIDMFKTPRGSWLKCVESVVSMLLKAGKPLLCVPGNHDPPESAGLFEKRGVNLHGKRKTMHGFDFVGFGGAATPFGTNFEPPDEAALQSIGPLAEGASHPLVFVLHNPPKNTKLDVAGNGMHVGSEALRYLILKHRPVLALTAHIHECSGTDILGSSTIFYPGLLSQGRYGLVDLDAKNRKTSCRIKTL